MKSYSFSPTKHFSNELYIRQECLTKLISKTSDKNKIRIWQRELDGIEIEIAEFEWYKDNSTYEIVESDYSKRLEKEKRDREKEEGDRNWVGCLGLLCPPLLFFIVPYWIWQNYQKGR